MTWTVDARIEDALYAAVGARLPAAALRASALTAAIEDRSRRYTSERADLDRPPDPNADLAARALFFSLADVAKLQVPLAELRDHGRGLPPELRVLDLGAGCGAMALAVIAEVAASGGHGPIRVTLVEHDARAAAIAVDAITRYAAAVAVKVTTAVVTSDVRQLTLPTADLVVVATLLNELPVADRLPLIERALIATAASPSGAVVVLEPALRQTTRDLHRLRDAVLERGAAAVLAPCTRRGGPCPMLADERDWCHEERSVELPPRTRALALTTGLRDGAMKFSYLVLAAPTTAGSHRAGPDAVRVVSAPLASKGKLELYGCGDQGRVRFRLLKRNRSPANRAFDTATRGDVLRLTPLGPEIEPDTVVERHTVAGSRGRPRR